MSKHLLLKHYRCGPVDRTPADRWTPEEANARVRFLRDYAAWLGETGESVDIPALTSEGAFARYDGEVRRLPVTDGPFVETKDLIAG